MVVPQLTGRLCKFSGFVLLFRHCAVLLEILVDGLKRRILENRHLLLASCVLQGVHLDSYKPRTISDCSVAWGSVVMTGKVNKVKKLSSKLWLRLQVSENDNGRSLHGI